MNSLDRLLSRNRQRFQSSDSLLIINPPDADALEAAGIPQNGTLSWCQDFRAFEQVKQAGFPAEFSAAPPQVGSDTKAYTDILMFLPREKDRLEMLLHAANGLLDENGKLWLLGAKRAGIGSSSKYLKKYFGSVQKVDSAGHGQLFQALSPLEVPLFDLSAYQQRWVIEVNDGSLEVCSYPGVFAHGKLDRGTALLLETLPQCPSGSRVLDLGCGAGLIGASLLKAEPDIELSMLDINALALLSSRETLETNGMRAEVIPSDGLIGIKGNFDLIISNPPFHQHHQQVTDLGMQLLKPARSVLSPKGKLVIVVNRHLPYLQWLQEWYREVQVIAENPAFRVLQASRPT